MNDRSTDGWNITPHRVQYNNPTMTAARIGIKQVSEIDDFQTKYSSQRDNDATPMKKIHSINLLHNVTSLIRSSSIILKHVRRFAVANLINEPGRLSKLFLRLESEALITYMWTVDKHQSCRCNTGLSMEQIFNKFAG